MASESQSVGGGSVGRSESPNTVVPGPAFHLRMCQCLLRVSLAVCFKFDPQTLEEPQLANFGEELVL